ncbi:MAG TPA: hypothetical protein DEF74_08300 [Pseudoalteromonas sp.]|jgi:hypothetical protein|uniref:Sugar transporter n=1 Tax=Pseudoalteromonas agarivorans TaxID=176102 RepID=A0ABR5VPR6_9GAMM|nr:MULTISPECIES: hypothetical protein [Pseudoalteromonas]MAJ41061.1 hypothetical protein [Pseudoalteromonadaceae bacterium]OUX84693.1 MAG: hypothetical protein CBC03_13975 [Pseudoalteromonas sp. TMED43]HBW98302.1 hypothetical protein [Pseudoalteromonas sp.]ETJ49106.1 hypothetical protein X564_05150 [Pseudoalteromonas agarivorans]KYL32187.1 hypothetical protein A2I98_18525 [Pseudoalteromonas telluritireducens]|tara:strand:+ start:1619 stop:2047 length:429 start_codon:yes stop_codon:yes gene_type:complete
MTTSATPNWFKPALWAALIWNLLGVFAFIMHLMMTPEMISKLPLDQQAAYSNVPLWSTIAFAVAVFGGTLGCILLLAKNAFATPTFALSLVAIFIQQFYNFIVINSIKMLGISAVFMPILVIVIAFLLLYLSIKSKQQGWLN